jgi:cytochrome b561
MKIFTTVMAYLRERQSPLIMSLHLAILVLVISQIIVSNFMDFTDAGEISDNGVEFYGTWLHIITGLSIIPLALLFLGAVLKQRGFKYYFPYLTGDFSQLKKDINQLMKLQLPEPVACGIAAIVQGLGLGALLLVLFSGLTWFLSWRYNLPWSDDVKEIHETLTGFLQAYLIGHGSMGILHIFFRSKLQNKS